MNPYLTMAMAQQRQEDLLRSAAHGSGSGARSRRRRKKLSLNWGLRRSAATPIAPAPVGESGGAA
jgi:hypothetical protein